MAGPEHNPMYYIKCSLNNSLILRRSTHRFVPQSGAIERQIAVEKAVMHSILSTQATLIHNASRQPKELTSMGDMSAAGKQHSHNAMFIEQRQ